MDSRVYELVMKSHMTRLAEVEEEIVTLEANSALNRKLRKRRVKKTKTHLNKRGIKK
jgi:hypothetical protein